MRKLALALITAFSLFMLGCEKTTEDYSATPISEYYPTTVGKYIIYNLDSLVFINFGKKDTIIKYQVRDMIDAQVTDASGRTAFRIIRSIRKNANQSWTGNNTFLVVPGVQSYEFVENNLRFIKLKSPVRESFSWKGNSFIDTYSLNSEVKYLDDWNYTYEAVNQPLTLGTRVVDSTITVLQRDEFLGQDPANPTTQYAEKNYGIEKYAKGIGLVFKEFVHWEYQGSTKSYTGYGVKLTMIEHN
jgi:hypothetical protein